MADIVTPVVTLIFIGFLWTAIYGFVMTRLQDRSNHLATEIDWEDGSNVASKRKEE